MRQAVVAFSAQFLLTVQVLVVAGVLGGLDVLGVNIKPILTLLGGSSIIVGLASQQLLANCFSGLNLVSCAAIRAAAPQLSAC